MTWQGAYVVSFLLNQPKIESNDMALVSHTVAQAIIHDVIGTGRSLSPVNKRERRIDTGQIATLLNSHSSIPWINFGCLQRFSALNGRVDRRSSCPGWQWPWLQIYKRMSIEWNCSSHHAHRKWKDLRFHQQEVGNRSRSRHAGQQVCPGLGPYWRTQSTGEMNNFLFVHSDPPRHICSGNSRGFRMTG